MKHHPVVILSVSIIQFDVGPIIIVYDKVFNFWDNTMAFI